MRLELLFFLCTTLFIGQVQAQNYSSIEATEYDASQDRWLTGNGSRIIAQSATGELSFFGTGGASYGMETMNGVLFAIQGSNVRGYDLLTEELVMTINIPGAGFLNGMGSDPSSNRLWVSDFSQGRIIEVDVNDLDNPSQQIVVNNTGSTPNGVVYDSIDDRVVFVSWGNNASIKAIDLTSYTVTTLSATTLDNIDGIDMSAAGDFFVSSWGQQAITQFNHDFSSSEQITGVTLSNPADISYADQINTLGVANSSNNTLTLIPFIVDDLTEQNVNPFDLQIFPNPVESASRVSFELASKSFVSLNIRDLQGRLVERILIKNQLTGVQQTLINASALDEGLYLLEFRVDAEVYTSPFVVAH